MVVLRADGTREVVGVIPLAEVQRHVGGGPVQAIHVPGFSDKVQGVVGSGMMLLVNARGVTEGLPYNQAASLVAGDVVVGDVVSAYAEEVIQMTGGV